MALSPFSFDENALASVSHSPALQGGGELDQFSREILAEMVKDGVPPLPHNFQSYFDVLLEEKPDSLKRLIRDLKEEAGEEDIIEQTIEVEKKFLSTVSQTKKLLQNVADIYQHMNVIGTKITHKIEKSKNEGGKSLDVAHEILNDWKKFIDFFKAEALKLNEIYTQNVKLLRQAESESIYDPTYHIFNGRYMMQKLSLTLSHIDHHGQASAFLALNLKTATIQMIGNDKKLGLINKTVAKLLDKTSRRSDIVGYMGQGTFGIILHHTTMENATKAATRIISLLEESNFFIDDKQLVPKVNIGIYPLEAGISVDNVINATNEAMHGCDTVERSTYKIAESGHAS